MRKVIHGTVLRSLFETARRQGRRPHQFFFDLFGKTTAQAQAALYRRDLNAKPAHRRAAEPSTRPGHCRTFANKA
jgi:hypothetical protein